MKYAFCEVSTTGFLVQYTYTKLQYTNVYVRVKHINFEAPKRQSDPGRARNVIIIGSRVWRVAGPRLGPGNDPVRCSGCMPAEREADGAAGARGQN